MSTVSKMPHSPDLEECLLGCMINDQRCAENIEDLSKDLFYDPKHQEVFDLISQVVNKGKAVNIHLLLEEKKKLSKKELSKDDLSFLIDLSQKMPIATCYDHYLSELTDLKERRRGIQICWDLLPKLEQGKESTDEVIDKAMQSFGGVNDTSGTMRSLKTIIKEERILESIKERCHYYHQYGHKKLSKTSIATKLYGIDTFLGGLEASRLYILGARPGIGKTAFTLGVSLAAAIEKHPVLLFSLEMGVKELLHRFVAYLSEKNLVDIELGSLLKEDLPKIESVIKALEEYPIFLDYKSGALTKIRSTIRRYKREEGIQLVVIDYLQLMTLTKSGGNRYLDISEISRELKLMAKEFDVAVLCLSQLSRASEKEGRAPRLSDLRDSGAIEQDADVVMLMDRYDQEATLQIAKNRHGPIGEVKLSFHGKTGRFSE